jgi:NTP pyrophosphatase (non-canonical NTP hydrolase)
MLRAAKFNLDHDEALALCGLGLTGEAGEIADIIKKIVFHGHDFDENQRHNFLEEAGDLAWYLAYLCRTLGSNFEEIFQMNIDKLAKRYPDGFSREASIARRDVSVN